MRLVHAENIRAKPRHARGVRVVRYRQNNFAVAVRNPGEFAAENFARAVTIAVACAPAEVAERVFVHFLAGEKRGVEFFIKKFAEVFRFVAIGKNGENKSVFRFRGKVADVVIKEKTVSQPRR